MKQETDTSAVIGRRQFIKTGVATIGAITIIPSHVFAAKKMGMVAPSDKIRLVHIGCGTEGHHEIISLLKAPAIEIVGVADPNRESYDYRDWSANGLTNELRTLMGEPNW
ncbi:MAG: hypothetical protein LBT24_03990, partial [Tannerella sp.]|nr:hypothetical protein [Tannerella sp.]